MSQKIGLNDLKPLKKAYIKAVDENKDVFNYKGQSLIVGYAKYLIEYLEQNNN